MGEGVGRIRSWTGDGEGDRVVEDRLDLGVDLGPDRRRDPRLLERQRVPRPPGGDLGFVAVAQPGLDLERVVPMEAVGRELQQRGAFTGPGPRDRLSAAASTTSASMPSTVEDGMPKAAPRPVIEPATAVSTGSVVA